MVLVLYDITHDRIRSKVAEACLDYGLDRTQFSAFTGDISRTLQEELMHKLSDLLGETPGAILMVWIQGDAWERRHEIRNLPPEVTDVADCH